MAQDFTKTFGKHFHSKVRQAYADTRTCYIKDCPSKPINAHSVTNNRLLRGISDNGDVMYMSTEQVQFGGQPDLVPTGRRKATAFPGFCDEHDKVFHPIDNADYVIGNQEQEFLFALRASAKEYTTRQAMTSHLDGLVADSKAALAAGKSGQFLLDKDGLEMMQVYRRGFVTGTKDLSIERLIFNANMASKNYWKIKTVTLEIDGEYPIVAASTFKLERGLNGELINDIPNLRARAKPFYFTLFPQDGKTYCLLSWQQRDNSHYEHLNELANADDSKKKVVATNLLCGYVENFAANPTYWNKIPLAVKQKFDKYYGLSLMPESIPFIYDDEFSIFI
jgi:hypothetical protein